MSDTLDLTDRFKQAIDGAFERGHPVVMAYVDGDGRPSLSVRGSAQVLNATEIGVWARKTDSGLAKAIESNPNVTLLFFGSLPDGAKMLANFSGRAHASFDRKDEVYEGMSDIEKNYDADRKGVAVIVEVDSVSGMTAEGPFKIAR